MIIYIILIITSIKLYDYHFTKCLPIYLIGHYNQLDCIINHKLLRQYLYEIIYVPAYIIMPMYNNDQLKINSRAEEKPIAVYRPLIVNILHSFISIYVLVIGTHDTGRLETTSILGMIYNIGVNRGNAPFFAPTVARSICLSFETHYSINEMKHNNVQ